MKNLASVFAKGTVISTRHGNQSNWISNIVSLTNEDSSIIEIPLKQQYISNLLVNGEDIDIKVEKNNYIYIAKGSVINILIDYPQKIILKIEDIEEFVDKREEKRFNTNMNCVVKGEQFNNIGLAVVIDMSGSGLGIVSRQDFPINSRVLVDILNGDEEPLKLQGIMLRKNTSGYKIEYGLTVKPLDRANKLKLTSLLKNLEKETI